jgi:vitamin B12 transporter
MWMHSTNILLATNVVAGGQFQFHEMDSNTYDAIAAESAKFNIDPYLTAVYNSDFGLNLNVGGRLNMHSVYNSNFVLM